MKRLLTLTFMAILFTWNMEAQVFDHLAVGAGTGLDATNIEIAAPIGNHVQLRLGYGTALGLGYTLRGDNGVWVKVHPDVEGSPEIRVPMKFSLARNDARLLANIYISDKSDFHFTVGAYLGSGSIFRAVVKDLPQEYTTEGVDLGGHIVKAVDNRIAMEIRAYGLGSGNFAVFPYAGIGFGRPVDRNRQVSFSVDLGAAYNGKPSLLARSSGQDGNPVFVDVSRNNVWDLEKITDKYSPFIYCLPVLNFHIYFNLF